MGPLDIAAMLTALLEDLTGYLADHVIVLGGVIPAKASHTAWTSSASRQKRGGRMFGN